MKSRPYRSFSFTTLLSAGAFALLISNPAFAYIAAPPVQVETKNGKHYCQYGDDRSAAPADLCKNIQIKGSPHALINGAEGSTYQQRAIAAPAITPKSKIPLLGGVSD